MSDFSSLSVKKLIKFFLVPVVLLWAVFSAAAQGTDPAPFNFENGELHGFSGGTLAPVITSDSTYVYAGEGAVKLTLATAETYEFVRYAPLEAVPGTAIDFYIYLPAGMTASIQPYSMDQNWSWNSTWIDQSSIANDTWKKISLVIPVDAVLPLNVIGIQIIAGTPGSLWVDSISFVTTLAVDKSALSALVLSAASLWADAVEGNGIGQYAPGAKALLEQAIDSARLVLDNSEATQNQVDDAADQLEAAVAVFEAAKHVLAAPGSLTLSVQEDSLHLAWTAAADGGLYTVLRAANLAGPFTALAGNLSGTAYTDNSVQVKTTYYYKVVTIVDGVESPASNIVYGKILTFGQLQELSLFKTGSPGWAGGDSSPSELPEDCTIEVESAFVPVDYNQMFNNLPSARINSRKNGSWWVVIFASNGWASYNLAEYYENGSLEFNIKGKKGGESFGFGIFDNQPERDPVESGLNLPITNFITITNEWQHVSIPLKQLIDPASGFNLESVVSIRLTKDWALADQIFTVWLNDMVISSPDTEKVYPAIKVNQVGYTRQAEKYALVSCFDWVADLSGTTRFTVKRAADDKIVYKGALKQITALDKDISGEKVYKADFSCLKAPGKYYVSVEAANIPDSYTFSIGDDIYHPLLTDAMRYFYYQRANMELTPEYAGQWARPDYTPPDFAAPFESDLNGPVKDVSGGWYDAGDFGKYTNAGATAVMELLWAYDLFPAQFKDNQYNIPESGNGMADILDEVKYEIDFLLKIQDVDGGFYHKVNGGSFKEDNTRFIQDTDGVTANIKPTNHTASAAGMLAHAAMVYKAIDACYAAMLKDAALNAWAYLEAHPEVIRGVGGAYQDDEDADDRLYAAAALYRLTGDERCNAYFLAHYKDYAGSLENPGNAHGWGAPVPTAYFHYYAAAPDKAFTVWFREKFNLWRGILLSRAYNNTWRNSIEEPDYYWGSASVILNDSMDLVIGSKLLGSYNAQVMNAVRSNLNFLLGINPLSFSFVSGYGENSMQRPFSNIYNTDGLEGVPPGILAGGPNKYQGSMFSRFSAKCYNDINTEWTTNEHTIYWNSTLVFSAACVNNDVRKKSGQLLRVRAGIEDRMLAAGAETMILTGGIMDDGTAADLTNAEITYTALDPKIAAVDETGKVTGVAPGLARIDVTIRYGNVSRKQTVMVIVYGKKCLPKLIRKK